MKKGDHEGRRLVDREGEALTVPLILGEKYGFCLEKDLPSDDYIYSKKEGELKTTLNEIGNLKKNIHLIEAAKYQNCVINFEKYFPTLKVEDLIKILYSTNFTPIIDQLIEKSCKNKVKTKPIDFIISNKNDSRSSKIMKINQRLNEGKPVGVNIDVAILKNREFVLSENNKNIHAVSIVGRKWNYNTQECDFILRNSWGRRCTMYDPRYKCDEETGYLTISSKSLENGIYDVVAIK